VRQHQFLCDMNLIEYRGNRLWLCSLFLFAFLSIAAQDSVKTVLKNEVSGNPASVSAPEEDMTSDPKTGAGGITGMPFNKNAYNLAVADALSLQVRADSLCRMAREKRILAQAISDDETKKEIISEILSLEREAEKIQREADERFLEARKMKDLAEPLPEEDSNLVLYKVINGIKVYQYKIRETEEPSVTESEPPANPDPPIKKDQESLVVSSFEILESAPYSEENPIPSLPTGIEGLVYRIQLGVFSKSKETGSFGGLCPLYVERPTEGNIYKYFAGSFSSTAEVMKALEQVRSKGFPDAFVVAFFNGKPVTTEKAREIEFAGLKL
jgi:hypothetical protein